jgi:hypothetical protein
LLQENIPANNLWHGVLKKLRIAMQQASWNEVRKRQVLSRLLLCVGGKTGGAIWVCLDFLAPLFASRQKVEKQTLKDY